MTTRGRRFEASTKAVKFCPWCGSNNVREDDFRDPTRIERGLDPGRRAWVCDSCFQGFLIVLSPRAEYARLLIREHAKLRPSHD